METDIRTLLKNRILVISLRKEKIVVLKSVTKFLLFFLSHLVIAQHPYQFLKLDFDSAIVYLYDGSSGQLIVTDGILDSTVIDKKGYKLSKSELLELDRLLSDTTGLESIETDTLINTKFDTTDTIITITETPCTEFFCAFYPRHGIVFYKKNKIVGAISVCHSCNQIYLDFGKTKLCPRRLIPLFDNFNLKVEEKSYKSDSEQLKSAIVRYNLKKYGEDYVEKRSNQMYLLKYKRRIKK